MGIDQHTVDEDFMRLALEQAQLARAEDEVPVGAVLVHQGEIIALAHNQSISLNDPSAHAEIMVLRLGGERLQNYRLVECDLYVTLEPCGMCASALVHARINRLIYGACDKKTGVIDTVDQILAKPYQNHQVKVTSGILAAECGQLLSDFFSMKRKAKKLKHCE